MKLKELDAVLRVYECNFRNLHWNSVGIDFNDSHKSITTEYYEMLSTSIDSIAEMICILGENPYNYAEALDMVEGTDKKYLIVDSSKKYDRQSIIELSSIMLNDICSLLSECIEEIAKPIDAGIRSELETMLYNYTLQARYINARRIG